MTTTQTTADLNKEVVRRVYESVSIMDVESFLACCAEDMVLIEAESLAVGGTYQGRDEVLGCIGTLASAYDWSTLSARTLVAEGDRVVAHVTVEAGGPDRMVIEISEWWTLKDGKVVECRPYYLDTEVMNRVLRDNAAANAAS